MRMPEPSLDSIAEEAYLRTYQYNIGTLNRKDRRTAMGKLLVAQAEIEALKAKIRVLENSIGN